MGRSRIAWEKKVEAVEKYKRGGGSFENIAREYGVVASSLEEWIANYEAMGTTGLAPQLANNRYSVEFKTAAAEAYLEGEGSQLEICRKYKIRSRTQLRKWVMDYNGQKDIRPSGGSGKGIYMTKGRSTTLEERLKLSATA